MPENRTDSPLTAVLRAGDPAAADPGLSPAQRAAMRQRLLAAGRKRRRRPHVWLLPAATAVALLALALGLALRRPRTAPQTLVSESPQLELAAGPTGHQVQFTTENGTLVVWVLQPRPTT